MKKPIHLCKVGGSLLDWAEFPMQLQNYLQQLQSPILLVMGGGSCADLVRQWDTLFNLGEQRSHQLALESMSLTARLLVTLLPDLCLIKNHQELVDAIQSDRIPVLDAAGWITLLKPTAKFELPDSWKTTSDSIALWLAVELGIEDVTLVKSNDYPQGITLETAAKQNLIDAEFPRLLKRITDKKRPINFHWHNLRANDKPDNM